MPPQLGGEVTLLFGIQLEDKQISFSSAEEDRGVPCFSARIEIAEIDLEINDLPHDGWEASA